MNVQIGEFLELSGKHSAGFSESTWVAYVRLERASVSGKGARAGPRLLDYNNIMDHFPTNWGRPVSMEPPASSYAEMKSVFIEV